MQVSDEVIDRILELLRRVEQRIEQIGQLIGDVLAVLPEAFAYIADQVRRAWDAMLVKLGEVWAAVADFFSYAGDAFTLVNAAEAWTRMAGKVAAINDTVTDLQLSVDDRWTGYAADQYQQSVEPQRRANSSILGDYAENIASAMSNLAIAIIAFWVGIAVAILSLLGAIAGAAGATATIVGLPAAPVIIGIGIAAFLVAAGGGVAILYVSAGAARSTMSATSAGITRWPKIATQ